jgi:four helix bundle protein
MDDQGAKNYRELRVWQAARAVKRDIYRLVDADSFRRDSRLRDQLREAAASAPSHISEGYGRFEPADLARFLRMAKASLIECQNHLVDAVDRGLISSSVQESFDERITNIVRPLSSLITYLQSPRAKKNAERIERQRAARYTRPRTANAEPRTGTQNRNAEQRNLEPPGCDDLDDN